MIVDPVWSAVWLVKGRFCKRETAIKRLQNYHNILTNMSIKI